MAGHAFETLWEAGQELQCKTLRHAHDGQLAESKRVSDILAMTSLARTMCLEAGLGLCGEDGQIRQSFMGREAVLRKKEAGLR